MVNSLVKRDAVPVYVLTSSMDAWSTTTTRAYEVGVQAGPHNVNIIDTPGISLEKIYDEGLKLDGMLIRSRGRVDRVKDPIPTGMSSPHRFFTLTCYI